MAPGCEPEIVTRIMQAMQPHVLGMSLAGAGGGGFMYLLTRDPDSVDLVRNVLTKVKVIRRYMKQWVMMSLKTSVVTIEIINSI